MKYFIGVCLFFSLSIPCFAEIKLTSFARASHLSPTKKTRQPALFDLKKRPESSLATSGSLFASMTFSSNPQAPLKKSSKVIPFTPGQHTQAIYEIIERAESRADGYNAIHHNAKKRPQKPPTQMTLGEIYTWIDDTPKQAHAIGRYQFIPATLRSLVERGEIPISAKFTPNLQDQLAFMLLEDAGIKDFQSKQITRYTFMHNLSKIWAGLPTKSGKSYYEGYAGNKASMSWAEFDQRMKRL